MLVIWLSPWTPRSKIGDEPGLYYHVESRGTSCFSGPPCELCTRAKATRPIAPSRTSRAMV
ncbi:MAG: hypothetical protein C4289_04200 [Chloroflexota bacterium]